MTKFVARYHGKIDYHVEAKHHDIARILARRYWVLRPDLERDIAVIDLDAAGRGRYTGHCQGCPPTEMCSRSGTCGWCDERYEIEAVTALDDHWDQGRGVPKSEQAQPLPESSVWIAEHDLMHAWWTAKLAACAGSQAPYDDSAMNKAMDYRINEMLREHGIADPTGQAQPLPESKAMDDRMTAAMVLPILLGRRLIGEAGTYSDPKCYACPGETVWARIQQEELDKVHEIWSRRAGDAI